jgi:tetratricopeptide (TPR) repeat protein
LDKKLVLTMNSKLLATALMMLLITACSTAPQTTRPEIVERPSDTLPESEPSAVTTDAFIEDMPTPQVQAKEAALPKLPSHEPKPFVQKPAVTALLAQAEASQTQGQHRQAQQHVQRAQRIAPDDPFVYHKLAEIHFDLESYALAEQVALKGISVANEQPVLLKKLWLLLAETRSAVGDISGAKAAKNKASQF